MSASMGPPLKAAENLVRGAPHGRRAAASMGPPLKAAENWVHDCAACFTLCSFNGAAAKSSGKYNQNNTRSRGVNELQWGRR